MLDLLVQSGVLVPAGTGFEPTGMALRAIEEAEAEDRKHKANLRIHGLLAFLAAVGLVMAVAQAGPIKLPMIPDVGAWLK